MPSKHIHEIPDAELDSAVARAIFPEVAPTVVPGYCTELDATWQVVERLRESGWLVVIKAMPDGCPFWLDEEYRAKLQHAYTCSLSWMHKETLEGARKYIHEHPWGFGDTLGQAVCRAALESVQWGW